MKKIGQFVALVMVFMMIAYMYPVFSPENNKSKPIKRKEKTDVKVSHTSFPYDELEATGLSRYIGKETSELTKELGEPIEIQQTPLDYEWWIFGEDETGYMQVAVKKDKVASIFALGDEMDIAPFKIGMDLADISDLITVYSNFTFQAKDSVISIELTEEDMNLRPLVAFDNGSFAILHLNQGTGKLIGIRYVNKPTLLRLMPYQYDGNVPEEDEVEPNEDKEASDWATINADSKRQLLSILNILRSRQHLNPYISTKKLDDTTEHIMTSFVNAPQAIIKEEERLEEWNSRRSNLNFNMAINLTPEEFTQLLKLGDLNPKENHGILYTPAYDVPFLALTWYSETMHQSQFTHKKDKEVGMSFYQDAVLFLFSEKESTNTNQTDNSESEK